MKTKTAQESTPAKGLAKLRYILFLLKPAWRYGKLYTLTSLLTAVLFTPASSVLSTLLPKAAIDAVMQGKGNSALLGMVALFTAGILAVAVLRGLIDQYANLLQLKLSYKLMYEVNERALYTDFRYYDDPAFYTRFNYAQQEYAGQVNTLLNLLPQMLGCLFTALAMGAIISSAGPVLLLLTLAFMVLQTVLRFPLIKRQATLSVQMTDISKRTSYVYRSLLAKENTAEIRSSKAGMKLLEMFRKTVNELIGIYSKYIRNFLMFTIPQNALSPIQSSVILLYILIFVIDGDSEKIGLYASLTAAAATLGANLNALFSNISNLFRILQYGERIAEFFDTVSVIEPPELGGAAPPEGAYAVELRDVSFGYRNAAFRIAHFDLSVAPGQRVAIVGENGAGKSTLTKLLLRLYDPDEGQVLINGRDIREFDVHALRLRVGIAHQDVRILSVSLRDNLTAYHDASDETLREIAALLGLEGVLEKCGGDLDTLVSREFTENGVVLSGGEAQRMALARLFTGSFGLLLLDEPSSALDPLAEYKLTQTILDKANTATTIMIAHRLSTVRDFDVIYHVENGAILEAGTHDELMAAKGKYYEMFTKQAENYNDASAQAAV